MQLIKAIEANGEIADDDLPGPLESAARPLRHIPRHYLRRPWIIDRLSADAPVTLVIGPAGTGKSVAVAGWASESDHRLAWVEVTATSAADSFWRTVADSLRIGLDSAMSERNPPVPPGDVALDLAARLAGTHEHSVLVIDNYHLAEDADLAASMALFLRNIPDELRVVIISRRVPLLPLDRMRVMGDLCELGADDLRFSSAEARELVETMAGDIDPRAVDTIIAAADGWVSVLRLGIYDRPPPGPDPSPSGVSIADLPRFTRHLEDFVMHEVLASESELLVGFLGDVAVVPRTSIALAEAITGREDAEALLELAHSRGLFVSRIMVGGHFEIHPVVRRALLASRERRDAGAMRTCRERAARWLEQTDDVVGALDQWLQVGDHVQTRRLLAERQVQLYDAGDEAVVRDVLAKLAPEAMSGDVQSLIDLAWCQMLTDLPGFRENVGHASWWAEHGGRTDACARRQLGALRAIDFLSNGDWWRAEREARATIDADPLWSVDPIVRTSLNDVARAVALTERWDDESDEARELTVILRGHPARRLALEATRALGMALAGSPVDALRVLGGIRSSTVLGNLTMSSFEVNCAEVIARRELGDAPDAESELERLINADVGPSTYVHGLAAVELVQLHLDRGSIADATRAFGQLERIVADEVQGPGGRTWLGRMGTALAIETGDPTHAAQWCAMIDDPFWGPVSRARALITSDREQMSAILDEAVVRNPRHVVIVAMLRAATAPDTDTASTWAESAVEVASANNLLQTLAATGQIDLLERTAWRLPSDWMDRLRRATSLVQPGVTASLSLIEPLTIRERDVLRFLPSRLTLNEIAAELYVSVNTLKFHLKVIYRKLGVNSRAEAAEVARSRARIDQR